MSCEHYSTCPLFKYFSSHPVLNLWRVNYCNKDNNTHCIRYRHTKNGIPNPVSLLPNGKQIELAPLALINAAKNNRGHLLRTILSNIEVDIDFQNMNGMTALMVAIEEGNNDIAATILHHGANPGIKNYNDETAYDIALRSRNKDATMLLRQYVI